MEVLLPCSPPPSGKEEKVPAQPVRVPRPERPLLLGPSKAGGAQRPRSSFRAAPDRAGPANGGGSPSAPRSLLSAGAPYPSGCSSGRAARPREEGGRGPGRAGPPWPEKGREVRRRRGRLQLSGRADSPLADRETAAESGRRKQFPDVRQPLPLSILRTRNAALRPRATTVPGGLRPLKPPEAPEEATAGRRGGWSKLRPLVRASLGRVAQTFPFGEFGFLQVSRRRLEPPPPESTAGLPAFLTCLSAGGDTGFGSP